MRFQKSIRICKGVRLNVSKSGVSATVGVKGISLNLGKKGVFLNTSLPGTGLSDRRKLFGGKKQTKKAQPEPLNPRDYELRAEDGEIRVLNAAGRSVSEEEARRVRRTALKLPTSPRGGISNRQACPTAQSSLAPVCVPPIQAPPFPASAPPTLPELLFPLCL